MLTCYLARPIDLHAMTPKQQQDLEFVRETLLMHEVVVFNPGSAFNVPPGARPHGAVQDINRFALERADMVVAMFPEATGIGVAMEIESARRTNKPILVVTAVADRSWSLAGVSRSRTTEFPTADQIVDLIDRATVQVRAKEAPIPLKVQLDDEAQMLTRGYPGDAGFDLYVQEDTLIEPGEFIDVPCGCAVQFPDHIWGMITGRSSTLRKHDLLVTTGVIDTGYRGPLFAGVKNLGPEVFEAKKGMRLAQLIPFPNVAETMQTIEVATLDPSQRGTAGFGSSGE